MLDYDGTGEEMVRGKFRGLMENRGSDYNEKH